MLVTDVWILVEFEFFFCHDNDKCRILNTIRVRASCVERYDPIEQQISFEMVLFDLNAFFSKNNEDTQMSETTT